MTEKCSNCSYLEHENAMLRAEIRRLEQEIRRLKEIIRKLRRIIEDAQKACQQLIDRADSIMSQHQPRGKWSFAKGSRATAQAILSVLRIPA